MADIAADINSFSFASGLTDDDTQLCYLRARSAGLAYCGCAHAVFLCKLVRSLRYLMKGPKADRGGDSDPCIGILGMGHLGKQLLLSLLERSDIKPSHIKISSRRPECAGDFIQKGVECFFDNRRLAAWADILFLCCLPSHLPKVCADLHSHLPKCCLVYCLTSAVPVTRLSQLLGHDFILKPQYDFVSCNTGDVWLSWTHLTTALMDPALIQASSPLSMSGGISLALSWVCAVMYSLLNICSYAGLGSTAALSLISSLLQENCPHTMELNSQNFISASSLPAEELFPWISLINAQTRETPLQCFISSSKSMQRCFSATYKALLETPAKP
ncbi:uncharacterized protein V6R79_014895 [Siganus canaliculatus]